MTIPQLLYGQHDFFERHVCNQGDSISFCITLRNSKISNCFFQTSLMDFSDYSNKEKLQMIEELLEFESDQSLCRAGIKCYEPLLCEPLNLKDKRYTIQLEALFLINQLYFKRPFFYSPYPFLMNRDTKEVITNGKQVKLVFKFFKTVHKKY